MVQQSCQKDALGRRAHTITTLPTRLAGGARMSVVGQTLRVLVSLQQNTSFLPVVYVGTSQPVWDEFWWNSDWTSDNLRWYVLQLRALLQAMYLMSTKQEQHHLCNRLRSGYHLSTVPKSRRMCTVQIILTAKKVSSSQKSFVDGRTVKSICFGAMV